MDIRRCWKITVRILLIAGFLYHTSSQSFAGVFLRANIVNYVEHVDIQNGDFIFQHLPGDLTEMILEVSGGIYSHCGIVVEKHGTLYVLEAIGPVKETPVNEWIARGKGARFTLVRLKKDYQGQVENMIRSAYRYLGRPYDVQYEWDDEKIYCSELIYKAVLEGAGIRIADFVRLGDLKWQPYEQQIRSLDGGGLPLDRRMITPDAVAFSDKVETIYSSFEASQTQKGSYAADLLGGHWRGRFTLFETALPLNMAVGPDLVLEHVEILRGGLSALSLKEGQLKQFDEKTGEFSFFIRTDQAVDVTVRGRVDHSRQSLYGTWRDQLGYQGTFQLSKME